MLRVNKHYINPDTDFDWDAFIEEKLGDGLYTDENMNDAIGDIAYDSSQFVDYTSIIGSNYKDYNKIYSYKNLNDYVEG